jgi:hypothetical protein
LLSSRLTTLSATLLAASSCKDIAGANVEDAVDAKLLDSATRGLAGGDEGVAAGDEGEFGSELASAILPAGGVPNSTMRALEKFPF